MEHATTKKGNHGKSRKTDKGSVVKNHLRIFHALLDYSDDSIEIVDMTTMRFVDVNDGACRALGYTREELLSMGVADIDPEFSSNRAEFLNPVMEHGQMHIESVHRRKDGSLFPVDVAVKTIKLDKLYGLAIARDITERKQDEKRLKLFRALLDQSDDAIEIIDGETYQFIDVNKGASRELGYSEEELLTMRVQDIDPEFDQHREKVMSTIKQTTQSRFESTHKRKDGSILPVEISLKRVVLDKPYHLAITRDITERKRAEGLLLESTEKYKHLVENLPALIYSYGFKSGGTYYSPQVASTLGYSLEQLYADPHLWHNSIHPDDQEAVTKAISGFKAGKNFEIEYRVKNKDGDWLWLLDRSMARHEDEDDLIIDGIAFDLTERKRAEDERLGLLQDIRVGTSRLESIFTVQQDVILLYDANMIAKLCTLRFKKEFGFDPIGMHLRDIIKRVAGRDMDGKPVVFGKNHPTAHALRGKPTPGMTFKVSKADGSTAIVEIYSRPYLVDGDVQGAVTVWHDVTKLMKASDDLAAYAKRLESAVSGTLQAVSKIVEQRDPYTAGHERRVGLIASHIAQEMGWSEEKCKELEMVGLVHDVGKIGVPAEILSKPHRLNGMELELVKEHVKNGYNILKDIEFPFPLAEIVYQHHERIDGSGYPRGLKGEDILPEARILAVADILEAIASHRPYRPALGIEEALSELTKNRGKLYDPLVVDTVLTMVREKGYQIPD